MATYQYRGKYYQLPDGLTKEQALDKIRTYEDVQFTKSQMSGMENKETFAPKPDEPKPITNKPIDKLTPQEAQDRMDAVLRPKDGKPQTTPYIAPDAPLGEGFTHLIGASTILLPGGAPSVVGGAVRGGLTAVGAGGATDVARGIATGNPMEAASDAFTRAPSRFATGALLGGAFRLLPKAAQAQIADRIPESIRKLLPFSRAEKAAESLTKKALPMAPDPDVGRAEWLKNFSEAAKKAREAEAAAAASAAARGPAAGQPLSQYFNKAGGSKAQTAFLDATGARLKGRDALEAKYRDMFMRRGDPLPGDLSKYTEDELAQFILRIQGAK